MKSFRLLNVSIILAALLFNNWVLGVLLNRHLFLAGGSVSEFSAHTQAWSWVFRTFDIASGLLFIFVGMLLIKAKLPKDCTRWLVILMMVLGLANCFDALFPLPCSGTVDHACNAPVRITWQRISLPNHAFSSIAIAICYTLLPIIGYFYARARNKRRLSILSLVTLAAAIIFFILLSIESFYENSWTDHLVGYGEELQMLILGWWMVQLVQAMRPKNDRAQSFQKSSE